MGAFCAQPTQTVGHACTFLAQRDSLRELGRGCRIPTNPAFNSTKPPHRKDNSLIVCGVHSIRHHCKTRLNSTQYISPWGVSPLGSGVSFGDRSGHGPKPLKVSCRLCAAEHPSP